MDAVALHKQRQTVGTVASIRHAVVAYQRECRHQYLTRIAGVCQTLRIARHRGVEYHLATGVSVESERPATERRTIFEY